MSGHSCISLPLLDVKQPLQAVQFTQLPFQLNRFISMHACLLILYKCSVARPFKVKPTTKVKHKFKYLLLIVPSVFVFFPASRGHRTLSSVNLSACDKLLVGNKIGNLQKNSLKDAVSGESDRPMINCDRGLQPLHRGKKWTENLQQIYGIANISWKTDADVAKFWLKCCEKKVGF